MRATANADEPATVITVPSLIRGDLSEAVIETAMALERDAERRRPGHSREGITPRATLLRQLYERLAR